MFPGRPEQTESLRLPRSHRAAGYEHTLPLVNEVLLLLVFVMLMGRLNDPQPLDVTLPQSAGAPSVETGAAILSVGADARMEFAGMVLDLESLPGVLRERMPGFPDASVRIKADARLASGDLGTLLDVLQGLGVRRVELLAVARP